MSLPLVSYVLICFNQEAFIAGAIKSALDQDYQHLEIIISDDQSTDGTFASAQAAIQASADPGRVQLIRTPRNLGLIGNLTFACNQARGDLIVIAAGDDISLPHRTSRLVDAWVRTGCSIVHSDFDMIDELGAIDSAGRPIADRHRFNAGPLFKKDKIYGFAGATAAYAADLVRDAALPDDAGAEDIALLFFCLAHGRCITKVDERLVLYRKHAGSLSHQAHASLLEDELVDSRASKLGLQSLAYLRRIYEQTPHSDVRERIDVARLRREIDLNRFRSEWMQRSTFDRMKWLITCHDRQLARWLAPRVFGFRGLALLRRLMRGA